MSLSQSVSRPWWPRNLHLQTIAALLKSFAQKETSNFQEETKKVSFFLPSSEKSESSIVGATCRSFLFYYISFGERQERKIAKIFKCDSNTWKQLTFMYAIREWERKISVRKCMRVCTCARVCVCASEIIREWGVVRDYRLLPQSPRRVHYGLKTDTLLLTITRSFHTCPMYPSYLK